MTAYAHLHWRSADGLTLHARDYPGAADRAPVICIHGLTRNARDFEDLAPGIVGATGRRVLAVDVRGRGASQRAADPMTYNPGLYAADILALLKKHFRTVKHAKPPASRKDSSEWYVIAQGFKG